MFKHHCLKLCSYWTYSSGNISLHSVWELSYASAVFRRLKLEANALITARENVRARLDRLQVYQKYLEKVAESAEEFHEIREILSRHDTLTSTYQVSTIYYLLYLGLLLTSYTVLSIVGSKPYSVGLGLTWYTTEYRRVS